MKIDYYNENQAKFLAKLAHKGQKDKAGEDYFHHLERVREKVYGLRVEVLAWLHDIVEDTKVELDDLRLFFPSDIVRDVSILSREDSESYTEYIRRVKQSGSENAIQVKLADLNDHLDHEENISLSLAKRYRKAKEILLYG